MSAVAMKRLTQQQGTADPAHRVDLRISRLAGNLPFSAQRCSLEAPQPPSSLPFVRCSQMAGIAVWPANRARAHCSISAGSCFLLVSGCPWQLVSPTV
ncbi:hypothetical protein AAFF_G00430210 [Aldrovandia affinis]|uniref:Uncharacterized protein n=1 Tax=Aldrovandia affinis TaxID=143900 RepID=A0AAD7S8W4_9TELE|nr:hypothetical protein AAFF_G00430210 [Aldrovandia affinis]